MRADQPPGPAALTSETLRYAVRVRFMRLVFLVGLLALPTLVGLAALLGLGPELDAALGSSGPQFRYRGGAYSPGALAAGAWLCCLLSFVHLKRRKDADAILARSDRLDELRHERARTSERRAAGKVAGDHAIPDDEPITCRRLAVRDGCPTLIRLSTRTDSWTLRRTDRGWVYETEPDARHARR